jgi:YesN/AraC family two-component response regulator
MNANFGEFASELGAVDAPLFAQTDAGPIRILSVDDHPMVRQGVAGLVATQYDMTLVAEAPNGREAIHQFRTHHPDVTLMDLQMPEMSGLDAIIASQAGRSSGINCRPFRR